MCPLDRAAPQALVQQGLTVSQPPERLSHFFPPHAVAFRCLSHLDGYFLSHDYLHRHHRKAGLGGGPSEGRDLTAAIDACTGEVKAPNKFSLLPMAFSLTPTVFFMAAAVVRGGAALDDTDSKVCLVMSDPDLGALRRISNI